VRDRQNDCWLCEAIPSSLAHRSAGAQDYLNARGTTTPVDGRAIAGHRLDGRNQPDDQSNAQTRWVEAAPRSELRSRVPHDGRTACYRGFSSADATAALDGRRRVVRHVHRHRYAKAGRRNLGRAKNGPNFSRSRDDLSSARSQRRTSSPICRLAIDTSHVLLLRQRDENARSRDARRAPDPEWQRRFDHAGPNEVPWQRRACPIRPCVGRRRFMCRSMRSGSKASR